MKFLVDNQLPIALARWLASRGDECQHVLDLGMESASDAACRTEILLAAVERRWSKIEAGFKAGDQVIELR